MILLNVKVCRVRLLLVSFGPLEADIVVRIDVIVVVDVVLIDVFELVAELAEIGVHGEVRDLNLVLCRLTADIELIEKAREHFDMALRQLVAGVLLVEGRFIQLRHRLSELELADMEAINMVHLINTLQRLLQVERLVAQAGVLFDWHQSNVEGGARILILLLFSLFIVFLTEVVHILLKFLRILNLIVEVCVQFLKWRTNDIGVETRLDQLLVRFVAHKLRQLARYVAYRH